MRHWTPDASAPQTTVLDVLQDPVCYLTIEILNSYVLFMRFFVKTTFNVILI